MPSHAPRPPAEFGGPEDQIQWITDTSRFLVFRPDQPWEERQKILSPHPENPFTNATFQLDDELVMLSVPSGDGDSNQVAAIWMVSPPEKDSAGDWFATRMTYNVTLSDDPSKPPTLGTEQGNIYELFGFVLPEHYEEIKEEYEAQSRERNLTLQGMGIGEGLFAFETLKRTLTVMARDVAVEMAADQEVIGMDDIDRPFDVVSDMMDISLERFGWGEGHEGMKRLVRRAIEELKQEAKNLAEAVALGLNVVSDEERTTLIDKLERLRANPDAHEITDGYPA